jgi:hypothetical protein
VEETYAGNACGSGLKAGGGVFERDTAQRIDGGWSGGGAGGLKLVEALTHGDGLACDGFTEDRCEEDSVYAVVMGLRNLRQGMAGYGDQGRGQVGDGVEMANLIGGEFAGSGGQVNSLGTCRDGDVGARVDEQLRIRGQIFENSASENGDVGRRKILFTELDQADAGGRPADGLLDELRLLLALVAGEKGAAGDGVTEHLL